MQNLTSEYKNTLKNNGYVLGKGRTQIGVVMNDVGANQLAYTFITNVNEWQKTNFGVDFCLFTQEYASPCMDPKFARFNIFDTSYFGGHLITTSIQTFLNTQNAVKSKRYFYVNYLEYLRDKSKEHLYQEIMHDDNIVKILRTKDYAEPLGISSKQYYVLEDFDINSLIKITQNYPR
jgi:hypothetical protein